MKKMFSLIFRQTAATVLIVIFVLAFGIYSTVKMPINLLPDINIPMICIQTVYPGANAGSVEEDVTAKLEEGLSSIKGVTGVRSYSYNDLSAVVLSFDYGTDTNSKKSDISSRISSIDLPDRVEISVYDIDLNAEALAVLSVISNKGETEEERLENAYNAARELSARLSAIDGVESVEIRGGADYSYVVCPISGMELAVPLLVQTFSYGSLDIPLGSITENGADIQIRNNSKVTSVSDIENTPVVLPESFVSLFTLVKSAVYNYMGSMGVPLTPELFKNMDASAFDSMFSKIDLKQMLGIDVSDELFKFIMEHDFSNLTADGGYVVSVKDIANVRLSEKYSGYVYYSDGKEQLIKGTVVEIYKSNGANSSAVVEEVKTAYNDYLAGGADYQTEIRLLDDQSEFITDSIMNVLVSMLIGGAIAVVVIFLFLKKVKLSLIITITMPLSVIAALIFLPVMDITLNMVSLGGLAVGIGMLVDNSIVVIECISKHRDMGKDAFTSAIDGVTEVGGALFGSTLTSICVFIPIIFTKGLTAEIFTDLSWAVIYSLTFSLVVAVTVIPTLYVMLCGDRKRGNDLRRDADTGVVNGDTKGRIVRGITSAYGKILPAVLKRKFLTILAAFVIFASSCLLLLFTGKEFLPSIDKGQLEVTMRYPATERIDDIEKDVFAFAEKISNEIDNIDYISVSVGKNGMLAMTDTGIITVQLTTNRGTEDVVKKIRNLAKDGYKPVGTVTVKEIDGVVASLTSGSNDLSVTVTGNDIDVLKQITSEISKRLLENGFYDITSSVTENSSEYSLHFDRNKLYEYGIDYETLIMTMRIGIASYTACDVIIDGRTLSLNVAFEDGAVSDIDTLKDFIIGFNGGSAVKLGDVCEITQEFSESCIERSGGMKNITVSAGKDTDTGSAGNEMQDIAKDVLSKYNGYDFRASGISEYLTEAFEGLAVALVISFFLLYAVMTIQFSSALKPLIIMVSIPFSFTGGFVALAITGTSLNVVSFIGLIMLMGVVVNNAIVMLEKIKQLYEEGMSHYEAVIEACKTRLRPILMTTLTTVLALIPMAVGVGQGSELMQPLGIVVIGGLLIGTLVTLVLVPTVYCSIHRISEK